MPILSDINIGLCREKLTPRLTPDLTLIRRVKKECDVRHGAGFS